MKFRTYGVSTTQAEKAAVHVFTDLYLRANKNTNNTPEVEALIEMMKKYPMQCQMVIVSAIIFAIGNFDRIEKIERWGTLSEDGDIDVKTLEAFDPKFVV